MNADPVALAAAAEPIVEELLAILDEEPDSCLMTELCAEGGPSIGISVAVTELDLSVYLDDDATDRMRERLDDAGFREDAAADGALVKHWPISAPEDARLMLTEAITLALRLLNEAFYEEIEQISFGWDGYVLMPMGGRSDGRPDLRTSA